MPRKTPEWIAKHPDQAIPARVKVRVFDAHDGKCALTGVKIRAGMAWECDHRIAIGNGGEHREANLQPVLPQAHKEKTREDVAQKAKNARVRKKHVVGRQSARPLPGGRNSPLKKKIGGGVVRRSDETEI